MKTLLMFLAIASLISANSLYAQDSEDDAATYIATSRQTLNTPTHSGITPCDQNYSRSVAFDLADIETDTYLDVALGYSNIDGIGHVDYAGFQDYNDGTGSFPYQDGDFFNNNPGCTDTGHIWGFVFGKMRTSVTRKDLAVLRASGTYIYLNTGDGMATSANQSLSGSATNGSWGPFNSSDNYFDLAVTNGSNEIRIYNSNNDGTLNSSPTTLSSTAATQVILAQLDQDIFYSGSNKADLVSYIDNTISIRLNTNSNGFASASTITFGSGSNHWITGIAVGDVNNDGWNDIVAVGYDDQNTAKLYLNNGSGTISSSATWTPSNYQIGGTSKVLIGDMGAPADAGKNDGWNDLVFVGYECATRIFINQKSGNYFDSTADQAFYAGGPYTPFPRKIQLADVQNTGGLSLMYDQGNGVYVNKHTGDPSPAPPTNVQGTATAANQYGYRYPKITWASNTERDLNNYELWRKITGICGNGTWYLVTSSISASTLEYIDYSIGTAATGNQCTATYRLIAVDANSNASDTSHNVSIDFGSDDFAAWRGDGGTIKKDVPSEYAVHPGYPNPFNPSTQIQFDLPNDGYVSLNVFDVLGKKVAELVAGNYAAGYHSAIWNASAVASGVYFARFTATDANGVVRLNKVSKLLLAK